MKASSELSATNPSILTQREGEENISGGVNIVWDIFKSLCGLFFQEKQTAERENIIRHSNMPLFTVVSIKGWNDRYKGGIKAE